MHCAICMFKKDFPVLVPANVMVNGVSLCQGHAKKVIDREDQLQGYMGWMLELENNDRW